MPRFDASTPITKVEGRIDGRPAKVLDRALATGDKGGNELLARLTIRVPPENVTVDLIAFNKHGAGEAASFYANRSGCRSGGFPPRDGTAGTSIAPRNLTRA